MRKSKIDISSEQIGGLTIINAVGLRPVSDSLATYGAIQIRIVFVFVIDVGSLLNAGVLRRCLCVFGNLECVPSCCS